MKRSLLSITLALILMLSLATMAFGADEDSTFGALYDTIEITNIVSSVNQESIDFPMDVVDEIADKLNIAEVWKFGYLNYICYANSPVTISLKKPKDTVIDTDVNVNVYDIRGFNFYYLDETVEPKLDINTYLIKDWNMETGVQEEFNAFEGTIVIEKPGIYYLGAWSNIVIGDYGTVGIYLIVDDGNGKESATDKVESTKPSGARETANPTSSTVLVNGVDTEFEAYNIKGNNYFMLRDLAKVIDGTDKNFEVTWDGANNAINLISNSPYTSFGGELGKGDGKVKDATSTTSTIFKDGVEVQFTAYNINGYNYFKLRDIATAFDIGVTWDGQTNTVGIDTTMSYILE